MTCTKSTCHYVSGDRNDFKLFYLLVFVDANTKSTTDHDPNAETLSTTNDDRDIENLSPIVDRETIPPGLTINNEYIDKF